MTTTTLPIGLPEVKGAAILETMMLGFHPFDERMDEGREARALRDQIKISEMTKETERLSSALEAQVSIRREMNQQLQRHCESRISVFLFRLSEIAIVPI